jgi:hypothetical protein
MALDIQDIMQVLSSDLPQPAFQAMRSLLAIQYEPSRDTVLMHMRLDQNRNPHNDNHPNICPRRKDSQIISDLKFKHADDILLHQYRQAYRAWLDFNNFQKDRWTDCYRRA